MGKMLLTSFNNGVVTPHIDARSDVDKYASSCRILENMLPWVYGDVERRPGTEFIAEAKVNTTGVRMIPFIFSAVISYMCEFGNFYIRFYYNGAPLLSGGAPVEVTSPYGQGELAALQIHQIGDTMWIVHPSHAPRKLTRTSATAFSLDTITFENGPFRRRNDIENDDSVTMTSDVTAIGDDGTLTASSATFEAGHVGSIWKLVQSKTTMSLSHSSFQADTASAGIDVRGPWSFRGDASSPGTCKLERNVNAAGWEIHRILSLLASTTSTITGTEDEAKVQYRIRTFAASGTMAGDLTLEDPLQNGIVRVDSFTSSTVVNITVLEVLVAAAAELRWAEGAWSGVRGYPTAVVFFEGRICYGGTATDPQTVWLSGSDQYEDFEVGSDDADSFALPLTATNRIRWLAALDALIVGTSGDEWRIASTRLEETLTPDEFNARRQTTYGGKTIQPIQANASVLFVDFVGRKIREFTYNADQQSFVAPDLTELAEHITATGIIGMAYQRNPDSIVWCVLTDGSLVSMTYQRSQNVVAWADHPMQSGVKVESVAVMPGATEDEVWILAVRTIEGATKRYIERMKTRVFATQADAFFVDSGLVYDGSETATFSGLDHLEGETVKILGDGAVFTPQVVANGSVTLDTAVSKAVVGLAYRYILKPMRIDLNTRGGSSKGSFKKIAEMYISFLNTLNAQYGKSVDALFDIPWRSEEEYTTPPDLFTGDKKVVVDGGFDSEDPIMISGDDPLPCTVRSLAVDIEATGG